MIEKQSLKDQIVKLILDRIKSGDILPGERLKELALAREFGTSQAPVREALRSLEASGIVEHKPNVGSSLKRLTLKEFNETAGILKALETYFLAEEFTRIQENISSLEKEMEHYTRQEEAENRVIYLESFHKTIIKAALNQTLFELWELLSGQLQAGLNNIEILNSMLPVYEDIIQAVEHGNEKEALRKLDYYYQYLSDNSQIIDYR